MYRKKNIKFKTQLKIILLLGFSFWQTISFAADNLFVNGGFESEEGFKLRKLDNAVIVPGKAHTGSKALLITGPLKNWGVISQDINLVQGKKYIISFWYKTAKLYGKDGRKVFQSDQNFKIIPHFNDKNLRIYGNFDLYSSGKWRQAKGYIYSPQDITTNLAFGILIPAGEIIIDDIEVKKMTKKDNKNICIKNGDFEGGFFPYGWSIMHGWKKKDIPLPTCYMDNDSGFFEGKKSLKLVCKEGDAFALSAPYNVSKNGQTFLYKIWLKSDIESMPLVLWINSMAGDRSIKHFYKQEHIMVSNSWKNYEIKITIPDSAESEYFSESRLALGLSIRNGLLTKRPAGTIWIDKVEVQKIASANE